MSEIDGFEPSTYAYMHKAFSETEYGRFLSEQTRWDRYRPHNVSPARWRELLGVDINNLGHLQLSGNLTRLFIKEMDEARPGYFSTEDKAVLEVAAYTHDWPEAIAGDTNYHHKTADHDIEEMAIFKEHLRAFYPDCPPELEIIINRAIDEVIYAHNGHGLARAFNTIERLGYARTPLRGVKRLLSGEAQDCEPSIRQMIGDSFSVHIRGLMNNEREFPPVTKFLEGEKEFIDQGFELVDEKTFATLHSDEVRMQFIESREHWLARSSARV